MHHGSIFIRDVQHQPTDNGNSQITIVTSFSKSLKSPSERYTSQSAGHANSSEQISRDGVGVPMIVSPSSLLPNAISSTSSSQFLNASSSSSSSSPATAAIQSAVPCSSAAMARAAIVIVAATVTAATASATTTAAVMADINSRAFLSVENLSTDSADTASRDNIQIQNYVPPPSDSHDSFSNKNNQQSRENLQTQTSKSSSASTDRKYHVTNDQLGIITSMPKRYQYVLECNRLKTFEKWPEDHHIRPAELAQAGYFYAGYSDCARCFYCGGGLRSWEKGDNVWVEHARFFLQCAFIQQKVGPDFMDAVKGLNMTTDTITLDDVKEELKRRGVLHTFLPYSKEASLYTDAAVHAVVDLGFLAEDACRVAVKLENSSNLSADQLFRELVLQKKPRSNISIESHFTSNSTGQKKDKAMSGDLRDTNNNLRQQTMCKICLDAEVSVIFLPCGHFASCYDCSYAVTDCHVCRQKILGFVRGYLA